jgi:hypothetical protein
MGLKKCEHCDEMVDEAKAFCPGCGGAFVAEEQRQERSSFERLDKTVQLGNTMYDLMLSDMGLDTKAAPKPEKRIEIITPIATAPAAKTTPNKPAAAPPTRSSMTLWIILGALALLVLLPFAVVSLVILVRAVMARF